MPTSKDIGTYPSWFFNVLEKFVMYKGRVTYDCGTRGNAIRTRQLFYSFRQLLQGDMRGTANALVVKINGCLVEFEHVDTNEPKLVSEERSGLPPQLPQGATFNFEPGDGSINVNTPHDPAEEMFAKLYNIKTNEEKARCAHEEDATGVMCVKCRTPISMWKK